MTELSGGHPPVLFLHIGWAREYRGLPDDPVQGKFGYFVDGGEDAGEGVNFECFPDGRCYGYAAHRKLNFSDLGGTKGDDQLEGVTVIWTATSPAGDGRFIVGWYRNATAYAEMQVIRPDESRPDCLVSAAASDCHLVPEEERTFFVPSLRTGWPGQAGAWYASKHLDGQQIGRLLSYLDGEPSNGFLEGRVERPQPATVPSSNPADPELRKKVEKAAEDTVVAYYKARGWQVERIGNENKGWDLDVRRGARYLRVEVKGRSGTGLVQLTPNEYDSMINEKLRMSYRLAIVFDAMSSDSRLSIFGWHPARRQWLSEAGDTLNLKPVMAATATF